MRKSQGLRNAAVMEPPVSLGERERAHWVAMRDTQAHGNIPTPADGELLARLAEAIVQLEDAEAIMRRKNLPARAREKGGVSLSGAMRNKRYWFNQVRLITVKCKFLRAAENNVQQEVPATNQFVQMLHVGEDKVWNTELRSAFVDKANDYARAVGAGVIPACKELKQACARHLADLERQDSEEFPFHFSVYMAHRACKFIQALPHVKGRWARDKENLVLGPWQCFIVCSLFGWLRAGEIRRRFTEAYMEICRKNGKSILAAAIAIYLFCADNEFGAEVFSGATTEKQAWEVFRPARLMLLRTPALLDAAGITVHAKTITREEDGSRFEPIIGKPGDGSSPSCAVVDEFHEHDTPDLVDTMQTGMAAREQPMLLKITTAGFNLAGPCYEHRTKAKQVLDGVLPDERLFAIIFTIDLPNESTGEKGDDWAHPDSIRKANPNLGVSVDEEFLLAQQRSALLNVGEQVRFKTKHLNVWCAARSVWIAPQTWMALGDAELKPVELKGMDCFFAFDLASKLDIAAYIMVFRKHVQGMAHYYIFGEYYIPEDQLHTPGKNQRMYQKWHTLGLLTVTDGATTDFDRIKEDIVADARLYNPEEIVFDPFNSTEFAQDLQAEGLNLVEFIQKPVNFAIPMDEVQGAIKESRIHHDNNECMNWMIANVTVRPAKKGLFWPTKESAEQKIDGPVAMIMGIGRAHATDDGGAMDNLFADPVKA